MSSVLPNLELLSYKNKQLKFLAPDTLEQCNNIKHFKSYPYEVDYAFNSRGYRDQEWPGTTEELEKSIWCVGDSCVMGIGAPVSHSWPYLLSSAINQRCINVSLVGASNEWIMRQCLYLLDKISVATLVIGWSFVHRRELDIDKAKENLWKDFYAGIRDSSWPTRVAFNQFHKLPQHIQTEILEMHNFVGFNPSPHAIDDHRILGGLITDDKQNRDLLLSQIKQVEQAKGSTQIVHTFIPNFIERENQDLFTKLFTSLTGQDLIEIKKIDFARDHTHFDIKSSTAFVKQLQLKLT